MPVNRRRSPGGLAISNPKSPNPSKRPNRQPAGDAEAPDSEAPPKKRANISKRKKPYGFRFLRLPREIRNMVYHLALLHRTSVVIEREDKCSAGTTPIAAPLLRTCKTVHAEARGILYSQQILIGDRADPVVWLRTIGPENRFYLRHVHLGSTRTFSYRTVAKLLGNVPDLESLEIRAMHMPDIWLGSQVNPDGTPQQRPWLMAAKKVAELLYNEFRPVFSAALSRGKTPQQLCTFVKAHRNLFFGHSDMGVSLGPRSFAPRRSLVPMAEAEEEVASRLKTLFERNLYYRRHPRFKQKPDVV
ncbi:hypothetical protein LX36DRAFT_654146 [Colletotrichum falcatum]|nr:hypothetical protein LX36DRAFT_654146 [Colletotrichum falcatum]